jgi:hypothetical protein
MNTPLMTTPVQLETLAILFQNSSLRPSVVQIISLQLLLFGSYGHSLIQRDSSLDFMPDQIGMRQELA